jgi:uncharacterized protein YjiS (DUF1127 family)
LGQERPLGELLAGALVNGAARWRWARSRKASAALARLDRRTLADVGIGPGAILSLAREVGFDRLRRPPHV